MRFPEEIRDVDELEELLSRLYPETLEDLKEIDGDFIVLGAGGKIGPSLVEMLARAFLELDPSRKIYAVSRFSRRDVVAKLKRYRNVEVIEADLSDREAVEKLPDARNVIFMVGRKFGTQEDPALTWITNAYIPALVAEKFRNSRFIIFSTGNVYPLVDVSSGGATEEAEPEPVGEYGWSALARERVMSYFIRKNPKSSGVIVRLNYACELRYGVLVDIALKVLKEEEIDLSMGYVNVIWQGDVNNYVLRLLKYASNPPLIINVTGPETASVKWIAEEFGKRFGKKPLFRGKPEPTALLSNASKLFKLLGYPKVSLLQMIEWISKWISSGKPIYNMPTHYEVRTGKF